MAPRHPHPRILGPLVAMLLLCCPQAALADSVFTITGHGWGHGVGMGQYGAQGYALNGWTHDRILARYYTGTALGQAPPQDVRVLLQDGRQQVVASSDAGLVISDEGGAGQRLLAGPARVTVTRDETGFMLLDETGKTIDSGWTGPVAVAAATGPVTLVGSAIGGTINRSYRGRLRVFVNQAGALATANVVGLEGYLKGVVASEMPSTWEPEALQAQAVAARSYALATRKSGASFDLYPDDRSQVYGGVQAERESTSAAVDATTGQIVTKDGAVVVTYFSSTTGGRSANIEEVFSNADPSPVFVSVDDPYDTISPYHDWTVTKTAAQVATGLKYAGSVTALAVDAYPSGRVKAVTADGTGGTVVYTGATARTRLGLRSTWFAVGGPPPRVAAASQQAGNPITLKAKVDGARVDLHGLALPGTATLQAPDGGSWRDLSTHAVGPDGALAFRRPFGEAARYRVSQGEVRSNEVAVQRATGLVLRGRIGGRLRGGVFPAGARGTVILQHVRRGHWRVIARTAVEAGGRFRFPVDATRGRWRVLFTGASLYRASRSPELHLPIRTLQWTPTDPQVAEQWGIPRIHAFDFSPTIPVPTDAQRVRVAVIDGGIDAASLDLIGPGNRSAVVATRRYLPGTRDSIMHGTAVAGVLAAQPNNGIGGTGVCVPYCDLVDLRVVARDGSIDPRVEARAIREAVSIYKVSVINLSLGGTRNPNGKDDEFSRLERDAVNYAIRKGVVVVAAVGNTTGGGGRYASYPAALPHVIGVSAIDQNDVVPAFSNRDSRYNDIAAPGVGVLTTLPSSSKDATALVTGTSFAAPYVSAAAAVLLARDPLLTATQVTRILERTAQPLVGVGGERSDDSGFGVLDLSRALDHATDPAMAIAAPDEREPDNDVAISSQPLVGQSGTLTASIDQGDDLTDVYGINLLAGDALTFRVVPVTQPSGPLTAVHSVWEPGTRRITTPKPSRRYVAGPSTSVLDSQIVAKKDGVYLIKVQAFEGGGAYTLSWTISFG